MHMTAAILPAILTIAAMMYHIKRYGQALSPDGNFYLQMASGIAAVPAPYSLRPLLPLLCRNNATRWNIASITAAALTASFIALLAMLRGADALPALVAGMAYIPLRIVSIAAFLPVLTDTVAVMLITAIGIADAAEITWLVVVLSVIGAMASEKTPVFAAALTLSPWPLCGLLVTLIMTRTSHVGVTGVEWLDNPVRAAIAQHKAFWHNPQRYLHTWGLLLPVALLSFSPMLIISLLFAYGQLLRAQDAARLIQYAAPAVCVAAALTMTYIAVPVWAMFAGLALHWWAAQSGEV